MTFEEIIKESKNQLLTDIQVKIDQSKKIHYLVQTFFLSFIALDLFLIISQDFQLKMQQQIFEVLLTLFNLMLGALFEKDWSVGVLVYYCSGLFFIVNLLFRQLVYNSQLLTFVFNECIIGYQILHVIKSNKLQFFCGFIVYLLIFGRFDQIIHLRNHITMLVPALVFFLLLVKFIKEIHHIYAYWKIDTIGKRYCNISAKLYDLSVFTLTALPLYWALVQYQLIYFTYFVLYIHLAISVFYASNHKILIFYDLNNKDNFKKRIRMNEFQNYCLVILKKQKKISIQFPTEYCSYCSQREVQVLFLPCNHFIFCQQCFLKKQIKNSDRCGICKKEILMINIVIMDARTNPNFQQIVNDNSQVSFFSYHYYYRTFTFILDDFYLENLEN